MPHRARALVAVALFAAGCAGVRPLIPNAARLCGPEISGAREVLVPGGTVLFGEMRGTNEIPRVVADLVCQASSRGVPLALAVELGASEQSRVDAFIASAGTADDREHLLNGGFWHRPYQDGRTSAAMVDLLDRVRALRLAGAKVRVLVYDTAVDDPNAHAEVMARAVLAFRKANPADLLLVLCGNVHARTTRGVEWDPTLVPMGARLREQIPNLISLDADWAAGTAWTCRLTEPIACGVAAVTAPRRQGLALPPPPVPTWLRQTGSPVDSALLEDASFSSPAGTRPTGFRGYRPYVRRTDRSPEGYDGFFYVGPLSASRPAAEGPSGGK